MCALNAGMSGGLSGGDPVMAWRRRSILECPPKPLEEGQAPCRAVRSHHLSRPSSPFNRWADLPQEAQEHPGARAWGCGRWSRLPPALWVDRSENRPWGGCSWTGRAGRTRPGHQRWQQVRSHCCRTGVGWAGQADSSGALVFSLLTCSLVPSEDHEERLFQAPLLSLEMVVFSLMWHFPSMYECMPSHFNSVQLFVTQWTVAHQAPLSMGILQPRILEQVAMPSCRDSPRPKDQNLHLLYLLHWQAGSLLPGKPPSFYIWKKERKWSRSVMPDSLRPHGR